MHSAWAIELDTQLQHVALKEHSTPTSSTKRRVLFVESRSMMNAAKEGVRWTNT